MSVLELPGRVGALERRLAELEGELARRPPASSNLQPNVITVQGGRIGAQFTGTVNALGLIIPAADVSGTTTINEIAWRRVSDGALVAHIYATTTPSPGGQQNTIIDSQAESATDSSQTTIQSLSHTGGNVAFFGTTQANDGAVANVGGGVPGWSFIAIDQAGRSNFPQLSTLQRLRVYGPVDAGVTPSLASQAEAALNIDLNALGVPDLTSTAGKVAAVGNLYDGGFAAACSWRFAVTAANPAAGQIIVHNLFSGAAAAGWRGWIFYWG